MLPSHRQRGQSSMGTFIGRQMLTSCQNWGRQTLRDLSLVDANAAFEQLLCIEPSLFIDSAQRPSRTDIFKFISVPHHFCGSGPLAHHYALWTREVVFALDHACQLSLMADSSEAVSSYQLQSSRPKKRELRPYLPSSQKKQHDQRRQFLSAIAPVSRASTCC